MEVRRRSDRVMAMVLAFGQELVRVKCACAPQSGRITEEKCQFYDKMPYDWDLQKSGKMVLGLGNFIGHVGKYIDGFEIATTVDQTTLDRNDS